MKKENVQTTAATMARTVSLNNMKILYLISALILIGYALLRIGAWYGYEKAAIEFEKKPLLSQPSQSSHYYDEKILKSCLLKLKELEKPSPPPKITTTEGKASYYSREGCLGCSATLTMANGEPLDDSKLTVAYNHAPLNSYISITNVLTGKQVRAKVTDRGGFERHGKIVDLSVATKDALGCGSTCSVRISHE